jgi:endonuclease/exonuclease/phosphatase (EEP) superfamily protein YafD
VRIVSWLLAIAVALWALGRVAGLDRAGHPFVALVSFTPHVTAASFAIVALLGALRHWRPLAVALAAAVALGAAVLPRAFGGGDEVEGPRLRVLSANVSFGRVPAEALVEMVRARRIDLLSVQELTPEFDAALREAGIAKLLPNDVVAPVGGATGTGLYARLGLEAIEPPSGGPFSQVAARATWKPLGDFEVVSVHPPPPVSAQHVDGWHETLRNLPRGTQPRMLAGDFNATLDHRELRRVLDSGYTDAADATGDGLASTWPANPGLRPRIVIDHVLSTKELRPVRTEILRLPRSDHHGVYVEVAARPR